MNRINSDDLVLGIIVSVICFVSLNFLGSYIIVLALEKIEKIFSIKFDEKYEKFFDEMCNFLCGMIILYIITCVKVSSLDLLASFLKLFYSGGGNNYFNNYYRTFLTSFVFMYYVFLCMYFLPGLLENVRLLFYKCIRKEPQNKASLLIKSTSYAVLITPIIVIGLYHLVSNLRKYYEFEGLLIPIRPYVLESFKAIKSIMLVVPGTNNVNLLGFALYSVAETVGMALIYIIAFLITISVFITLFKLCALFTRNESDAAMLFSSIIFVGPIVAVIIAILCSDAGIFIVGFFGIILIISFIAATIFKCVGETVAYGVSSGLQNAGLSKSTSNTVGAFVGGVAAGALLKTTVNTVKDTISSQPGDPNQVTTYDPGINPDQIHVDGYYRHDGTYVHGHQRTKPNDIIGDNISSK